MHDDAAATPHVDKKAAGGRPRAGRYGSNEDFRRLARRWDSIGTRMGHLANPGFTREGRRRRFRALGTVRLSVLDE